MGDDPGRLFLETESLLQKVAKVAKMTKVKNECEKNVRIVENDHPWGVGIDPWEGQKMAKNDHFGHPEMGQNWVKKRPKNGSFLSPFGVGFGGGLGRKGPRPWF